MRALAAAILLVCAAVGLAIGVGISAQQGPTVPNPIAGPPLVPLAESCPKWPLPASEAEYGRIDGAHLKPYVEQLAAISPRSRTIERWWGRITGTPAHAEARQLVAAKLRGFGIDVRLVIESRTSLKPSAVFGVWTRSGRSAARST